MVEVKITAGTLGIASMPRVFIGSPSSINFTNNQSNESFHVGETQISGTLNITASSGNGFTGESININGQTATPTNITLGSFGVGSKAMIGGLSPGDFTLTSADKPSATGNTLVLRLTPDPGVSGSTTSIALPGYSTVDLASGKLTAKFQTDPQSGTTDLLIQSN